MLNKRSRLRSDKDFRKVFKSSTPFCSGKLIFRALKRANSDFVRFGFIISNKIDKRSSRRNSLKRRLRASARELTPAIKPGYDIIVIVRSNFPFPFQSSEIFSEFKKGIKAIGLLNDPQSIDKNNKNLPEHLVS